MKSSIPLPEVHTVYRQLKGREGIYYLTNAGCVFLPPVDFVIDLDKEPEFAERRHAYHVPSDTILYTEDFCLMYRVRHYPVMMLPYQGFAIMDFPKEVIKDRHISNIPVLNPGHIDWGIRDGELCDLDAEIRLYGFLDQRLVERDQKSSGPF